MPRPEKVQAVEEITQRFEEADAVFLTEYRGLSVAQQQTLRGSLRAAGASYKVLKMSLTRRALEGRPEEPLTEWLIGPTAIAFVDGDPVPTAKALTDFADEHDALVIKAGALDGEILSPEVVAKLARIEPREVLLAKIAGAAKAPMANLASMLTSFTRDAASMFSQLLEKKESEGPAEPVADDPADAEPDTAEVADVAAESTEVAAEAADGAAESTEAAAEAAEVPAEAADEPVADDDTPAADNDGDGGSAGAEEE